MKALLIRARLWILALPILIAFLGAASNQAVLWANHDKFPVRLNAYKTAVVQYAVDQARIPAPIKAGIKADGLMDPVHCIMTDQTHLNLLADWIDLKDAIYSPGDLLFMLGDWLFDYAPLVWAFCMIQLALTGKLQQP